MRSKTVTDKFFGVLPWRKGQQDQKNGTNSASYTGSRAPIALPGIVSGIALRTAIGGLDIPFSFWTIVVGHATFCVVVVYNNVLARFRRTNGSLVVSSMDLGA